MKATEQFFPVVLFNMLYNVVLTLESVYETLSTDGRRFITVKGRFINQYFGSPFCGYYS